jgi:hypothetical protein
MVGGLTGILLHKDRLRGNLRIALGCRPALGIEGSLN